MIRASLLPSSSQLDPKCMRMKCSQINSLSNDVFRLGILCRVRVLERVVCEKNVGKFDKITKIRSSLSTDCGVVI